MKKSRIVAGAIIGLVIVVLAVTAYVTNRQIPFDRQVWIDAGNQENYSIRGRMVDDIRSSILSPGSKINDAVEVLGKPDNKFSVLDDTSTPKPCYWKVGENGSYSVYLWAQVQNGVVVEVVIQEY